MSFDETWHDNHTLVRLHCDGNDCWGEVARQMPECRIAGHPDTQHIALEFLLQPRDGAQRPVGLPLLLHVHQWRLHCDPATGRCHAWSWLPPKLTQDLLRRCHLRVRTPTLSPSSDMSE